MRKLAVLLAGLFMLVAVQTAEGSVTSVFDGKLPCVKQGDAVTHCAGNGVGDATAPQDTVPSWDGTPIDINFALPDSDEFGPGPYPLAMIFHGYGGGKEGFGGDMKRFTDSGMAAFSMTERGFRKS